MKIHVWKLYYNALPVTQNLKNRGCGVDNMGCCLCGHKEETVDQLFIQCWWARAFWNTLKVDTGSEGANMKVSDWLWQIIERGNMSLLRTMMDGTWVLWKNRNTIVHDGKGWLADALKFKVLNYLEMFGKRSMLCHPVLEGPTYHSQE